jgi:hypothetical protein
LPVRVGEAGGVLRFHPARVDEADVQAVQRAIRSRVLIEAEDRAGLERLLRYCARPAFASERLEVLLSASATRW